MGDATPFREYTNQLDGTQRRASQEESLTTDTVLSDTIYTAPSMSAPPPYVVPQEKLSLKVFYGDLASSQQQVVYSKANIYKQF